MKLPAGMEVSTKAAERTAEAIREDISKKVVIGDGAEWIWNLAHQDFPSAIQIVDLCHARQHLWELARKLRP
jgi:transposase